MLAALWLVPVIAVLPFKDVSGGAADSVGEAIREVLTADLAEVAGVSALSRAAVDRALTAQKLVGASRELDGKQVLGFAKAVGATLVIVGAYRFSDDNVKVWARFYEKGKLKGTATGGGPPRDFLLAMNTVAAEALRATDVDRKTVAAVAYRLRPRLRSKKAVALYGAALLERSDERRRDLLHLSLDEDPTFPYAFHALEELEARLPQRDAVASSEQEQNGKDALDRLRRRIQEEKDPAKLTEQYLTRFSELQKQRRYRLLIAEASAVLKSPPPSVPELSEQLPESAQYLIVAAYDQLNDDDAVLREGQRFLAKYSLSDGFPVVRQLVDQALERKQKRDAGVQKAADALAKLPAAARADACRVAEVYDANDQLKDARQSYEQCLKAAGSHDSYLVHLLWVDYHLGDFQAAIVLVEQLRKLAPARYKQVMHLVDEIPVD
jgi:hypothetical protein